MGLEFSNDYYCLLIEYDDKLYARDIQFSQNNVIQDNIIEITERHYWLENIESLKKYIKEKRFSKADKNNIKYMEFIFNNTIQDGISKIEEYKKSLHMLFGEIDMDPYDDNDVPTICYYKDKLHISHILGYNKFEKEKIDYTKPIPIEYVVDKIKDEAEKCAKSYKFEIDPDYYNKDIAINEAISAAVKEAKDKNMNIEYNNKNECCFIDIDIGEVFSPLAIDTNNVYIKIKNSYMCFNCCIFNAIKLKTGERIEFDDNEKVIRYKNAKVVINAEG